MNINDIRQLAGWLAASDIASLELRRPDATLRLHMDRASPIDTHPGALATSDSAGNNAGNTRSHAGSNLGGNNSCAHGNVGTGGNLAGAENTQQTQRTASLSASAAGVFLDRHPSQAQAFISIGVQVTQGDLVGLLQIGPLLLPVLASISGTITQCVAQAGTTVGYGDVLFSLIQNG